LSNPSSKVIAKFALPVTNFSSKKFLHGLLRRNTFKEKAICYEKGNAGVPAVKLVLPVVVTAIGTSKYISGYFLALMPPKMTCNLLVGNTFSFEKNPGSNRKFDIVILNR